MATRYVTTNVRFAPDDYADLQRLAAASGHSLAECVRIAVSKYLGRTAPPAEAGEAAPEYGPDPAAAGEPVVPAVVRGSHLVLQSPLPGTSEGDEVWVRCLSPLEVAQRRQHRRVIANLLAEFEALPPGKPARRGTDDKELYR